MGSSIYSFCVLSGSYNSEVSFPARLDVVLRSIFPVLSRNRISAISDEKKLFINGRHAKPGDILRGKEEVTFEGYIGVLLPSIKRLSEESKPNIADLDIIYEDEYIVAVNKPRGMHSVLQRYSDPLTLADLLADYNPELIEAGRDQKESGLVQRLDFWTSGVIISCKTKECWEYLHLQLTSKQVEKTYIAEIAKDVTALPAEFRSARFEIYKELHKSTLLRITLNDGSRHIVRRLFSELGYPLLGDKEYGSKAERESYFLHSEKIKITLPDSRKLELNSPPILT